MLIKGENCITMEKLRGKLTVMLKAVGDLCTS